MKRLLHVLTASNTNSSVLCPLSSVVFNNTPAGVTAVCVSSADCLRPRPSPPSKSSSGHRRSFFGRLFLSTLPGRISIGPVPLGGGGGSR